MPKASDKVATPTKDQDLTQNVKKGELPKAPTISKLYLISTKVSTKVVIPFNIVEQMKKGSLNVSMWNDLSISSQRDLIQEALKEINVAEVTSKGCTSSTPTS